MRETKIYRELKKSFNMGGVPKGVAYRIETGIIVGIPDISYTYCGTTGWCELKQTKQQKSGKIKIPYRPGQQSFLTNNRFYGGMCFVLLYLDDKYYLINKNFNVKIFKNICELMENCCWSGKKLDREFLSKLRKH